METKLKDVKHLYLGCTTIFWDEPNNHSHTLSPGWLMRNDYMLALRPVSDMTIPELIDICRNIYKDIFNTTSEFSEPETVSGYSRNKTGVICKSDCGERIGLTIETEIGIEFSIDSRKMNVQQFSIIPLILKNGIDLFGLIESGEVLNKSELMPAKI